MLRVASFCVAISLDGFVALGIRFTVAGRRSNSARVHLSPRPPPAHWRL